MGLNRAFGNRVFVILSHIDLTLFSLILFLLYFSCLIFSIRKMLMGNCGKKHLERWPKKSIQNILSPMSFITLRQREYRCLYFTIT